MKFKKILPISLLALALVSCNTRETSTSTSSTSGTSESETTGTSETSESSQVSSDEKVLILYFDDGQGISDTVSAGASNSGGGERTYTIANKLHSLVDSDLVEVTLEDPYTSDDLNYGNSSSRVVTEHDAGMTARPALSSSFSLDTSKYSKVVVGYPLWWMDAPWPLLTLFEDTANYSFAGKTIRAFNSNNNSGSRDNRLREALPDSTFLTNAGFSTSTSEDTLNTFLTELINA